MTVNVETPDKGPNLALMKISTYHKDRGDTVRLNFPLGADKTYSSVLLEKHRGAISPGGTVGGPGWYRPNRLPSEIERCPPDYSLYPTLDYSLGYTYRYCPRKCPFCVVPEMEGWDRSHHSISEFHDDRFDTIRLLNNNTFADPDWELTFREIDAKGLKLIEGGFDIRLLDKEKAEWLGRLRWAKPVKFAFDFVQLESVWREKAPLLRQAGLNHSNCLVYILVGFNSTFDQDMHRIEVIRGLGFEPFVMMYRENPKLKALARWCNRKELREVPWQEYDRWQGEVKMRKEG